MNYENIMLAFDTPECQAVEPENVDDLQKILGRYGVAYESWGQGPTKQPEALLKEIVDRETRLVETAAKTAIGRIVRVAAVDVFATVDDRRLKLIEARQEFRNGTTRERTLQTSLSEKLIGDEVPEAGAVRGMYEELGVAYGGVLRAYPRKLVVGRSESYPGLLSIYSLYHFEANFSESEYDPSGYMEVQDDKTTFFSWQLVE